ncbi:5-formyltetrahydrofolate cyclo-ligase [Mergibacter septicus]|uniref:5-formyltetrahydrofolate cyclo-ligase n=1 Tax=Mergibacter septicus TaxID=221402 RepID=A0A8E3MG16_9PAST|nr:5-formyltetrahydrofolate cyclo-ligase [Mergibacter septicus]AWX14937.1 5-formyltetrahydrofolate cyclo-ligase [Mergibacter septicus]QDJ14189.1 5-formyltetrahydrofolate cyclo-ligase [Mergibacter septicus]UTU48364.1 5-formyltetrahydrofolate cyclo-ligase [Mergibacter septicus]WMR96009.1 5-formyltetrahydrofolate cyclo-ligase [Mergibacter septicus]
MLAPSTISLAIPQTKTPQQISQQRQQLRQTLRQKRAKLSLNQQQQASQNISQQALKLIQQRQAKHIALYLPFDHEIDTTPLIHALWQQKQEVYLPVLHPFSPGYLLFINYRPNTAMVKNKFGIFQPKLDVRQILPLNQLDIIFTPLVGFDSKHNRLGMGGGFYDRTLQNWQQTSIYPVGLAYACQQVKKIPTQAWDIGLAKVLVA